MVVDVAKPDAKIVDSESARNAMVGPKEKTCCYLCPCYRDIPHRITPTAGPVAGPTDVLLE